MQIKKDYKYLTKLLLIVCIFTTLIAIDFTSIPSVYAEENPITINEGSNETITAVDDTVTGSDLLQFNYVGAWGTDTGISGHYNGSAHWSDISQWSGENPNDNYVEFTFEGTGIEVYGTKEPGLGIYSISVDGNTPVEVDAYNANEKIYQQLLFSNYELENTRHTIKIMATGKKNDNSSAASMLIDYVNVYAPATTANAYTFEVGQVYTLPGVYQLSDEELANVIWSSDDSEIASIVNGIITANKAGITTVYAQANDVISSYEITVINEMESNEDYFYSETIYNSATTGSNSYQFNFVGSWGTDSGFDHLYNGDAHWSDQGNWNGLENASNNYYTFKFTGKKISVYGDLQPGLGIYEVKIDDVLVGYIDAYGAEKTGQQLYFESPVLSDEEHTLKVTMTGTKNEASKACSGFVDFVSVAQNTERIFAEEITLSNMSAIFEQYTKFMPSASVYPTNTNQRNIVWIYDESELQFNDDGSFTPLVSGTVQLQASIELKDGSYLTSDPLDINILEANPLIKMDFSSNNDIYLQEDYIKLSSVFDKENTTTLWRNDEASASIAILSKNEELKDVVLSASDFTNENGDVLASSNIEVDFQQYVSTYMGGNWISVSYPYATVPEGYRGDYPDIIWGDTLSIPANSVQPVWVSINVPKDTKPGLYEGVINATLDDGSIVEVTQYVEVLDIVLEWADDDSDDDYFFDLWQYPHSSARYYDVEVFSQEHFDILREHMEPYKNIGPTFGTASIVEEPWNHQTYDDYPSMIKWTQTNGEWTFDYTDYDLWVDFLLEEVGVEYITCYSMVPWNNQIGYTKDGVYTTQVFTPGNADWKEVWSIFLIDFIKHLDEKGWYDQTVVAMDERTESQMIAVLDLLDEIADTTNHTEALKVSGAFNAIYDDVWSRMFSVTPWMGTVHYRAETFREICEKRRENGQLTSVYTMLNNYPGTYVMSYPSEAAWTIWYTESLGADGYLKWAYDAWVEDPLEDTSHWYFESGDTSWIYPGEIVDGVQQVRTSPRFERMSEATRDVRKLRQIANMNDAMAYKAQTLQYSVTSYWDQYTSNGIGSGFKMPKDEATKLALDAEVDRMKNETMELTKEYLLSIVDDSELRSKINEASELIESYYTVISFKVFSEQLSEAKDLLLNENAMQYQIDNAYTNLCVAIEQLVKLGDGSKLEELISNKIDQDAYTESSYRTYEKIYEKAVLLLEDTELTQEQIDEMYTNLCDAIEQLVKLGDSSKLEELISNKIDQDAYTESSYRTYEKMYEKAVLLLEDTELTQEEIDEMYRLLNATIVALTVVEKQLDVELENDKVTVEDEVSLRVDVPITEFIKVVLNGEELDSKYYDLIEGSIIVVLKTELLSSLDYGTYEISIVCDSGVASTTFEIIQDETLLPDDNNDLEDDSNSEDEDTNVDVDTDTDADSNTDEDLNENVQGDSDVESESESDTLETPDTGDTTNTLYLYVLFAVSILGFIVYKKKKS